mmetsp:Transcript_145033/g.377347  ORF Transcript_145033/g.377347 Transcript_145033/m.377347 type:complete len:371 (-) Transcript_145033:114-1226(-)
MAAGAVAHGPGEPELHGLPQPHYGGSSSSTNLAPLASHRGPGPTNPLNQDALNMKDFRYNPNGMVDDDDDDDELELMARREMDEDDAIDISMRPPRPPQPSSSEQSSRPPTFGRHTPSTPATSSRAAGVPAAGPPHRATMAAVTAPPRAPSPSPSPPPANSLAASGGSIASGASAAAAAAPPPAVAPPARKRSASRHRLPTEVSNRQRMDKRDFIVDCIINDELPSRTATPRGISTPRTAGLPRSASRGPSKGPAPLGARVRGASCNVGPDVAAPPKHRAAADAGSGAASGRGHGAPAPPSLMPSPRHKGVRSINLLEAPSRAEEKSCVSSLPQLGTKTSKHQRSQHAMVPSGSQSARSWRGRAALSVYA